MSNPLFNAEKMYTYIRGYASALVMKQTLCALTYSREKHNGQIRNRSDRPSIKNNQL